jgi:hypothetical protein
MRQRCLDRNHPTFKNYGARGITFCRRWRLFENFLADMGERPKGLTLERRNTNRGYYPRNCRWATRKEQGQNRRNARLSKSAVDQIRKAKGQVMQKDLAKQFGVVPSLISMIQAGKRWC